MSSLKLALVGTLGTALSVTGLSLGLAPAPAQAVGGVFISEFHYDNDGDDVGEFVEVTAPAGTDLSAYSIARYSGDLVYTTPAPSNTLTGTAIDQADGWGTGVVNYPLGGLQNGGSDGIALIHSGTTVVEFFSYEGSITATNGPAAGRTATAISVSEGSSTPAGQSLQRQVNGTWAGPAANTKGAPNGYDDAGTGELSATNEPDVDVTVDETMATIVLNATGGTPPYAWSTEQRPPRRCDLVARGRDHRHADRDRRVRDHRDGDRRRRRDRQRHVHAHRERARSRDPHRNDPGRR